MIIGVILGIPLTSSAQEDEEKTLTSGEAVEIALEGHPMLRKAKLSVEEKRSRQKALPDLPRTEIFLGQAESKFGEANSGIWSTGISQELEMPMKYMAEGRYRKQETALADRNYSRQKAWLKRNVRIAYYEAAHKKAVSALYDRLMEVYGKMEKAAGSKHKAGAIGLLEKTSMKARYRELKAKREEIRAETEIAEKTLQQWMGVKDTVSFSVGELRALQMDPPPDSAFQKGPGIAVRKQAIRTAEANRDLVKASQWPGLKLSYRDQQVNGLEGFFGYQLGLLIPLDFWNQKGRMGAARIKVEKAQAAYEEFLYKVRSRYEKNRQHYLKYREKLQSFREGGRLDQARLLMKTANKRYKAGSIEYVKYARVMDQAIRIRQEYLDALLQYNVSIMKTNYLIGQL